MKNILVILVVGFLAETSFADIIYKCTYRKKELGISETFQVQAPQAPLISDSSISFKFNGREISFDFWKPSRPGNPDTLAVRVYGGVPMYDLQFSYPIYKIDFGKNLGFNDSESLYCYDLFSYSN